MATPEDAAEEIRAMVRELSGDKADDINRRVSALYEAGIVEGFHRALEAIQAAEATAAAHALDQRRRGR